MTGSDGVEHLVTEALVPLLGGAKVVRVESRPTGDEGDHEVLRLTVVLDQRPVAVGTEWPVLEAIGAVQQALARSGEPRFPVIDFVTEDELQAG
jgi:hypothetical protein